MPLWPKNLFWERFLILSLNHANPKNHESKWNDRIHFLIPRAGVNLDLISVCVGGKERDLKGLFKSKGKRHLFKGFVPLLPECLGGTPKFLVFYVPPQVMFYCIFKKRFSKMFEIWNFMSGNFFRKISRKFPEIFEHFQNRKKNYYFCTQNIPKSLYLLKFGQIFPQNTKNNQFSLKPQTLFFQNLKFYVSKISNFLEKGSPMGGGSPQKTLWLLL